MQKSTSWFGFYFLVVVLYSVFSYSMTDPNLVLSSWAPYWSFQQWMWQTFFHNSQLLSITYSVLIGLMLVSWWGIVRSLKTSVKRKEVLIKCLLLCLPLFFSYNALSHDVFNYIFNAKMVVVYQDNPHVHVALDYSTDLWTRFMHNTHTPAPYGYGWTAFSVIPYLLGMNKFVLTWFMFRGVNVLAIPVLFMLLGKLGERLRMNVSARDLAIVFLSPLFLIEIVSNSHNDLWMLVPAVAALWLVSFVSKKELWPRILLSLVLLSASISTKLATITLLPLWTFGAWRLLSLYTRLFKWVPLSIRRILDAAWGLSRANLGLLASLLMFLPLLSSRSQFFHPWYLLWSFIWFPLIGVKWWRSILVALAISSLYRYVPWLLAGGFPESVLFQQQAVTWLGGLTALGLHMAWNRFGRSQNKQS